MFIYSIELLCLTAMKGCVSVAQITMQELADQTPLGRVGAAAEVADSILYLCSDKSSFITGQVLGVTGGF